VNVAAGERFMPDVPVKFAFPSMGAGHPFVLVKVMNTPEQK
jgi:hypothetical protein